LPTTIQDIANCLNLSHAVVFAILNYQNDRLVSPATREQVWQMAVNLGYRPSLNERNIATEPTGQLGLWMSSIYTAFHAQIINQVEANVRRAGYQLVIRSVQHGVDGEILPEWNLDGCLAFECAPQVQALAGTGRLHNVPMVCMGGANSYVEGLDCVEIDLAAGANRALRHLSTIGCKSLAYLGPDIRDKRLTAYHAFVEQLGQQPQVIFTATQTKYEARRAAQMLAASPTRPDGIFCFNDDMAIACCAGLRDANVNIPLDIAVVGCDGIEEAGLCDPPITTLAMPVDEMCRQALLFLHDRLTDFTTAPRHRQLSPSLVLRDSSNRATGSGI
jgi:LacI family transcriptional regulator